MPMYDYACDDCGYVTTVIAGTLERAEEMEETDPEMYICPDCNGALTRAFPRSNFTVRGGTPRHHR